MPNAPAPQSNTVEPAVQSQNEDHRYGKNHIFWVIPNYRADESPAEIQPLTPTEKMKVAVDDSFDPSAFLVAGVFAGVSMAQRQYGQFGHGAQAFGSTTVAHSRIKPSAT